MLSLRSGLLVAAVAVVAFGIGAMLGSHGEQPAVAAVAGKSAKKQAVVKPAKLAPAKPGVAAPVMATAAPASASAATVPPLAAIEAEPASPPVAPPAAEATVEMGHDPETGNDYVELTDTNPEDGQGQEGQGQDVNMIDEDLSGVPLPEEPTSRSESNPSEEASDM